MLELHHITMCMRVALLVEIMKAEENSGTDGEKVAHNFSWMVQFFSFCAFFLTSLSF